MTVPSLLHKIVTYKKEELERRKKEVPLAYLKELARTADKISNFRAALRPSAHIHLIAEVKKASPSQGVIRADFNPVEIAKIYEESGADAISVLTDRHFFQGDLEYLKQIHETVHLPLLRKDFIFDSYQIYEAKAFGASAILLIVALLEENQLKDFLALAEDLALDCLVEIHTRGELDRVLPLEAPILGINNRDLNTFHTDLATTFTLLPHIPQDRIIVSESGIHRREDVLALKAAGVHGILVGESLMKSPDIRTKIKELCS
jgi:indole-3-glycerol phosphate synthase